MAGTSSLPASEDESGAVLWGVREPSLDYLSDGMGPASREDPSSVDTTDMGLATSEEDEGPTPSYNYYTGLPSFWPPNVKKSGRCFDFPNDEEDGLLFINQNCLSFQHEVRNSRTM